MDGSPRENSKTPLHSVACIGGMVLKIPPRRPGLIPIAFFNLVVQKLKNEATAKDSTDIKIFKTF